MTAKRTPHRRIAAIAASAAPALLLLLLSVMVMVVVVVGRLLAPVWFAICVFVQVARLQQLPAELAIRIRTCALIIMTYRLLRTQNS